MRVAMLAVVVAGCAGATARPLSNALGACPDRKIVNAQCLDAGAGWGRPAAILRFDWVGDSVEVTGAFGFAGRITLATLTGRRTDDGAFEARGTMTEHGGIDSTWTIAVRGRFETDVRTSGTFFEVTDTAHVPMCRFLWTDPG